MDALTVPLFLSTAGLETVQAIYHRRNPYTDRPAAADYDRARELIFERDWDDYDEVYIALYTLRLTGGKWLPRKDFEASRQASGGASLRLDCTLDIDLKPDYGRQWLLDEWAVAEIIDFRAALQLYLPFRSTVVYVGFGCFMVSFLLSEPKGEAASRLERTQEVLVVLNEYLQASNFQAIRQRYSVSDFVITRLAT